MATTNLDLYRRGRVPGLPESNEKYLQDELRKLENQAQSQFDKFELIDKDISGNTAAIALERTVRADETESLAQQIESIVAGGARVSTFAQDNPPATAVEGDLWFDTDDGRKLYRYKAATGWGLVDDARIATNSASITAEQTARTTADEALATQITTVTAAANRQRITRSATQPAGPQVGDLWIDTSNKNQYKYWSGVAWVASEDLRISENVAAITSEQNARITADATTATRVDNLETNTNTALGNVNSRVTDEVNARTTADASHASRLTTVETTAGKQRVFRQSTQPTAYFTGDVWYDTSNNNKCKFWNGTAWIDTDNPKIDQAIASVSSEATTRIQQDNLLAARIDTVTTTANNAAAAVTTETNARVSADSATASQISNLYAAVGSHTTSIQQLATADANFGAKWGVALNVNGYVTGFTANNGGGVGNFAIIADNFSIHRPSDNAPMVYWHGGIQKLVVRGDIEATSLTTTGPIVSTPSIVPAAATQAASISGQTADLSLTFNLTGQPGEQYLVFIFHSLFNSFRSIVSLSVNGGLALQDNPAGGTTAARGISMVLGPGTYVIRGWSDVPQNSNGTTIFAIASKR